jgi:hypothetical protein
VNRSTRSSKDGVEDTVRVAKADLVPTETNAHGGHHLATHGEFGDLVRADETHSARPGTGAWERRGRKAHLPRWTLPRRTGVTGSLRRDAGGPAVAGETGGVGAPDAAAYLRAAAADVLATAKAQRWDPAAALRSDGLRDDRRGR